jgi:hypothetical protein
MHMYEYIRTSIYLFVCVFEDNKEQTNLFSTYLPTNTIFILI